MVSKKAGIIALSLLTAALLAVGGTIAYFTARAEVENVVTMGNVKISLTEPSFAGGTTGGTIGPIVPGDVIAKDPTITNTGKNDCYVRAKIKVRAIPNGQINKKSADPDQELEPQVYTNELFEKEAVTKAAPTFYQSPLFNVNLTKWTLGEGGYFYLKEPLSAASVDAAKVAANESAVLFDKVYIPCYWGNKYADVNFEIEIVAEAVQKDNFKPVTLFGNIVGWNNIPIEG